LQRHEGTLSLSLEEIAQLQEIQQEVIKLELELEKMLELQNQVEI